MGGVNFKMLNFTACGETAFLRHPAHRGDTVIELSRAGITTPLETQRNIKCNIRHNTEGRQVRHVAPPLYFHALFRPFLFRYIDIR